MIDDHQQGMAQSHCRLLGPSSNCQVVGAGRQVGVVTVGRRTHELRNEIENR